jgi:hypothetical protein
MGKGMLPDVAEKMFPTKTGKQTVKVISKKLGKGKAEDRLFIDGKDVGRWGEIYNRWKYHPLLKNHLMMYAAAAEIDPKKIRRNAPLTAEEANKILKVMQQYGLGGFAAILSMFAGQEGVPGQIGLPTPPTGGTDAEVEALEKKIEELEKRLK